MKKTHADRITAESSGSPKIGLTTTGVQTISHIRSSPSQVQSSSQSVSSADDTILGNIDTTLPVVESPTAAISAAIVQVEPPPSLTVSTPAKTFHNSERHIAREGRDFWIAERTHKKCCFVTMAFPTIFDVILFPICVGISFNTFNDLSRHCLCSSFAEVHYQDCHSSTQVGIEASVTFHSPDIRTSQVAGPSRQSVASTSSVVPNRATTTSPTSSHAVSLSHHSRKFDCDLCTSSFTVLGNLSRHLKSVHRMKQITLTCRHCPYTSVFQRQVQNHLRRAHTVNDIDVVIQATAGPSTPDPQATRTPARREYVPKIGRPTQVQEDWVEAIQRVSSQEDLDNIVARLTAAVREAVCQSWSKSSKMTRYSGKISPKQVDSSACSSTTSGGHSVRSRKNVGPGAISFQKKLSITMHHR